MAAAWVWMNANAGGIQTVAIVATAIAAFWVILHNGIISRREATIQMVNSQLEDDSDSYQSFKDLITNLEAEKQDIGLFAAETLENKPSRDILLRQLNRYELISLAIKKKVFDEKFYKRWFFSQLTRDYAKLLPFINAVRSTFNNDAYYCEFEALAERWNRKKHPVKHPPKWKLLWWVLTNQAARTRRALEIDC